MHFHKTARHWWSSLCGSGKDPKTWEILRNLILKTFLPPGIKNKVLTAWRSLKITLHESIHKYVEQFFAHKLKANVYKSIDFEEEKEQFLAGLPEEMSEYVNSQRIRDISQVLHHTMVASTLNFNMGNKKGFKVGEARENRESKGKNQANNQNPSMAHTNNPNGTYKVNKTKEKGYKVKTPLTKAQMEQYWKDNKCFKCGEQGHVSCMCPKRHKQRGNPRATLVKALEEDCHHRDSSLSYTWGKVREHDALIFFCPGSTHNFISTNLATKIGIHDFEMGKVIKIDGAFQGQEVSITPFIGKLRLHIQSYVDKEDFFISPLKNKDVILGAPCFDRLLATIKFLERKILFSYRGKDALLDAKGAGGTIPMLEAPTLTKVIKNMFPATWILLKSLLRMHVLQVVQW